MRPVYITNDAVEISSPVVLDIYVNPQHVSVTVTVSGTNTSKVQYSFDDPFATYTTDYNADGTWIDSAAPLASITTGTVSSFLVNSSTGTGPVRAVRLNTGTFTSGSAKMTVIQSGIA
jgi:FlaG/FlaF family flagellin (archaellin)